jgi:Ran GTPase-activating protein (RanGAP) involved in mRNA processing and transport
VNMVLQTLRLRGNVLGYTGVQAFADMLKVNTGLQELALTDNSVGDAVGTHLADALVVNRSLRRLDLRNNLFGDKVAEAFEAALSDGASPNRRLTHLHLNGNKKCSKERKSALYTLTEANKARERRDRFGKGARSEEL